MNDDRLTHARIARLLAHVLDTSIRVPGTSVRIGLDPIIGLIPGIGDALASVVGTAILLLANQAQVPKIVLARMSLNIAINGVIGAIPLLGDLFSVWFKSNVRNVELLERHSTSRDRVSTASDWAFVLGLVLGIVVLLAGAVAAVIWVVGALWRITQGA